MGILGVLRLKDDVGPRCRSLMYMDQKASGVYFVFLVVFSLKP